MTSCERVPARLLNTQRGKARHYSGVRRFAPGSGLLEETLGVERRHAPRPRGSHGLPVDVVGDVASQIQGARTPVSQAAADRAVRAVYAAAPFRGLPREFYGERIAVTFSAREACAR